MVPIHIEPTRSGGVAGISLLASVNTSTPATEEAREIGTLVGRVDFAGPATPGRGPPGPPIGSVRPCGGQGSARHKVSLPEMAALADLELLLDHIIARARRG